MLLEGKDTAGGVVARPFPEIRTNPPKGSHHAGCCSQYQREKGHAQAQLSRGHSHSQSRHRGRLPCGRYTQAAKPAGPGRHRFHENAWCGREAGRLCREHHDRRRGTFKLPHRDTLPHRKGHPSGAHPDWQDLSPGLRNQKSGGHLHHAQERHLLPHLERRCGAPGRQLRGLGQRRQAVEGRANLDNKANARDGGA